MCEGQREKLRVIEEGMSQRSGEDVEVMRGLGSSGVTQEGDNIQGGGNFSLMGCLMASSFPPVVTPMRERREKQENVRQTGGKRVG